MAKTEPSRLRPLTLRLLTAPARASKRVRQPRNLHIRTLVAMARPGPSRPRPQVRLYAHNAFTGAGICV
ncbi:hypothetical protein BWR10_05580 [Lacticaseibacillus rhamnosus]|uniref:Uncharacterized protein n=1 Tax=Lacticaseibacillus rhamnosus TaxID=47715 RepID=A0AAX0K3J7_LACRH|nr:hypothetical protein BWR10_05580 [Lacticaseibacillus rhamnosus]